MQYINENRAIHIVDSPEKCRELKNQKKGFKRFKNSKR